MYESPGIPVKSMLEDEDGAGDVSLVLRAKDAESDSTNLLDMVRSCRGKLCSSGAA